MRGVKPKLKAIDGGLVDVPALPERLPEAVRADWSTCAADLVARRVLTAAALGALETYVMALHRCRQCNEALERDGLFAQTATGQMKAHPAAGILSKAQETVARLAAELGLTPAARSRKAMQPAPDGKGGGDGWSAMDI